MWCAPSHRVRMLGDGEKALRAVVVRVLRGTGCSIRPPGAPRSFKQPSRTTWQGAGDQRLLGTPPTTRNPSPSWRTRPSTTKPPSPEPGAPARPHLDPGPAQGLRRSESSGFPGACQSTSAWRRGMPPGAGLCVQAQPSSQGVGKGPSGSGPSQNSAPRVSFSRAYILFRKWAVTSHGRVKMRISATSPASLRLNISTSCCT